MEKATEKEKWGKEDDSKWMEQWKVWGISANPQDKSEVKVKYEYLPALIQGMS